MANLQFNDQDLSEVHQDIDALELAAAQVSLNMTSVTAADLPTKDDICHFWQSKIKDHAELVRKLLCRRVVRILIGNRPCNFLSDLITWADQVLCG